MRYVTTHTCIPRPGWPIRVHSHNARLHSSGHQPLSQHRQALAVHSIDCSPHPLPACTLPRWRRYAAQAINRYRERPCLAPSRRSAMSACQPLVNAQSHPSNCVMQSLYISRPVAAPSRLFLLQQVCQVQSCRVRFLSILFYPPPSSLLFSSGPVPSNHHTTDDLIPPSHFYNSSILCGRSTPT